MLPHCFERFYWPFCSKCDTSYLLQVMQKPLWWSVSSLGISQILTSCFSFCYTWKCFSCTLWIHCVQICLSPTVQQPAITRLSRAAPCTMQSFPPLSATYTKQIRVCFGAWSDWGPYSVERRDSLFPFSLQLFSRVTGSCSLTTVTGIKTISLLFYFGDPLSVWSQEEQSKHLSEGEKKKRKSRTGKEKKNEGIVWEVKTHSLLNPRSQWQFPTMF